MKVFKPQLRHGEVFRLGCRRNDLVCIFPARFGKAYALVAPVLHHFFIDNVALLPESGYDCRDRLLVGREPFADLRLRTAFGRMLASADLGETVRFLREAERSADEKIAELNEMKERIARARRFYEGKSSEVRREGFYTQHLAQRTILLSDRPIAPTVADLLNYQRHFFAQVGEARDAFAFEDVAGIYRTDKEQRMFAVCTRYAPQQDLRILPKGTYLCADCTQQEREDALHALLAEAKERGFPPPPFTVSIIVLAGVAQWGYRLELPLGAKPAS